MNDNARTATSGTTDPFLAALRQTFRHHFTTCVGAYLALTLARAVTINSAPDEATAVATTWIGSLIDFVVVVLMLTFLRVLYAVPFLFVRKSLSRVGNFVLFTCVFGFVFAARTNQCVCVEAGRSACAFCIRGREAIALNSAPKFHRLASETWDW